MSVKTRQRNPLRWLLHVVRWVLQPAVACFELPMRAGKRDLELAVWLWNNDPDPARRTATALLHLANNPPVYPNSLKPQRVTIVSFAPLFLIAGLVWLLGVNGLPADVAVGCVGVALSTAAVAFVGTSIVGLAGLLYAIRKGIRVWLDEDPHLEYAMNHWPPVGGESNQAPLFCVFPIFVIFVFGVMAVPEKWMYHAAVGLLVFVPPILWIGHKSCARSIEECYGEGRLPQ